ncbi:hypothetical protein B0H19DRAFT_88133 [Mycena capillaripes]|nr:hypothetical protein B0H19DRAFT_88133 [Mycena capillaripes]
MDILQKEREFCSDFKCCDARLSDLHALYDHFETCHPGNDICDLPFSVPCAGPSSSGTFSEALEIPAPPSSLRKKSLFTRVPLPPIPPVSPATSTFSSSASTPEPSSASSSSKPERSDSRLSSSESRPEKEKSSSVFRHYEGPSVHTRDKIYTPVAVPATLRLEPSPTPTPLSWSISTSGAIYPGAYGYGYFHYPTALPVPHIPVRSASSGAPPNVEVIDIDQILPSPSPPHATSFPRVSTSPTVAPPPPSAPLPAPASLPSTPLPPALLTPASALPAPPPPPPWQAVSQVAASDPNSAPERPRSPPSAKGPCKMAPRARAEAAALTLANLRKRFIGSLCGIVAGGEGLSGIRNEGSSAPADALRRAEPIGSGTDDAARAETPGHDAKEASPEDAMQVDGASATANTTVTAPEADAEVLSGAHGGDEALDDAESHGLAEEVEVSQTRDALGEMQDEGSEQIDDPEDADVDAVEENGAESDSETTAGEQTLTKPPLYLHGKEKIYVCPVPLCIKVSILSLALSSGATDVPQAYLNPNGLRYHAKHGTCVMENGNPCPSSLSLVDTSIIYWPMSVGTTVSPSATTSDAVGPVGTKASGSAARWMRTAGSRKSARLAGSTLEDAPATAEPTPRGSVKARSKAKSKAKSKSNAKSKPKSSSTSSRTKPASSAASPADSADSDYEMSDDDSD